MSLNLLPYPTIGAAAAWMLSARARCSTWDATADGYVRSEACGGVVAQPLRERPLTRLARSAVRQDGRSASLTAPSGAAQRALLEAATARSGLSGSCVATLEAHGTGTPLGDPIEASAVSAVLPHGAVVPLVAAIKANVGHAEPAAAMASLLAATRLGPRALLLPNAQLRVLNTHVRRALAASLAVPLQTCLTVWAHAATVAGGASWANGVSSFGFTGTIAHALLLPAPPLPVERPAAGDPPPHINSRRAFGWSPAGEHHHGRSESRTSRTADDDASAATSTSSGGGSVAPYGLPCGATPSVGELQLETVAAVVGAIVGSAVDVDAPLHSDGLDSLGESELRSALQSAAGLAGALPPTLVADCGSVRRIHEAVQQAARARISVTETSRQAGAQGVVPPADDERQHSDGEASDAAAVERDNVRLRGELDAMREQLAAAEKMLEAVIKSAQRLPGPSNKNPT